MSKPSNEEVEYEKRLRRRLLILQQKIKDGKVKIQEGLRINESLKAIKYGADGEIDLNTVDGLVRAMALAITELHDREELKKACSLAEIQNSYFNILEKNFSHFYDLMRKKNLTPHTAAHSISGNAQAVIELTTHLKGFLDYLKDFWNKSGEIAYIHVEDMHKNIKGVFGGDLFPTHDENLTSKCCIYTDTIILPDPFLRSLHIFEKSPPAEKAYYFIKHAMNILQYKELACAEVEIPIVVVLPDIAILEQEEREFYLKLGQDDSLKHSEKLFGRAFTSIDELLEFSETLDTIERAVAQISDKSRVLFDTSWTGDVATQLIRASKDTNNKLFGLTNPGRILLSQSVGRMSVSNELLIKARRLNGIPIIDAPTSWQYLVWKMEYDANQAEQIYNIKDLHIVRGLQNLAKGKMQWLGNVPPNALIEVRKQGAMEEIRNILGTGIDELISDNLSNYQRSHDQLFANINNAFEQHKANIKKLRAKKWKFVGSDVGSWLVTGTLAITSVATGYPVWGLAAYAVDQVLDPPKLKELPNSIKELITENNKIQKSPVGMLFYIAKKNS